MPATRSVCPCRCATLAYASTALQVQTLFTEEAERGCQDVSVFGRTATHVAIDSHMLALLGEAGMLAATAALLPQVCAPLSPLLTSLMLLTSWMLQTSLFAGSSSGVARVQRDWQSVERTPVLSRALTATGACLLPWCRACLLPHTADEQLARAWPTEPVFVVPCSSEVDASYNEGI